MTTLRLITHDGFTGSIADWAKRLGMPYYVLERRLQTCPLHVALTARRAVRSEMWPGANHTRWDDDPVARAVVHEFAALSLETCGHILGLSRERVRQVEVEALEKLRRKGFELKELR